MHLDVQEQISGLAMILPRLRGLQTLLSTAFLASSVNTGIDGQLFMHFSGSTPSECVAPSKGTIEVGEAWIGDASNLARLALWSYARGLPDQLLIGREALARELPPGETLTLMQVASRARAALQGAEANFILYLRKNAALYAEVRMQALSAVDEYSASVRKSVGDLTGSVVENVFRTAGLLVGVAIAGFLAPTISITVKLISTIGFLAYIIFILIYMLPAYRKRYEIETALVGKRLVIVSELGEQERTEMYESTSLESAYFENNFRNSVAVYALLYESGLIYLFYLAGVLLGRFPSL
jgi:hypothetical protein